jgi:hypothetical protein
VPGRVAYLALLTAVLILAQPAFPGDEFQLEGTYRQGAPCIGNGSDPALLMVTFTPDGIKHGGGECSLSDKRYADKKLTVHATCKFPAGVVMGSDITFTLRDDSAVAIEDQDKTFSAVLYKCPR